MLQVRRMAGRVLIICAYRTKLKPTMGRCVII